MKIKGRWKKSDIAPVYERQDGFRVHVFGLIRTPDGKLIQPDCSEIAKFRRIVGGRSKRAMMALCNHLFPINQKETP